MSLGAVENPFTPIVGLTGIGLNDGDLYIGVDGMDPEVNPQACFWDEAGTIPAAQPIDILGGYPMRLGTPARVYTASSYSMRVRDKNGVQVFYVASALPGVTNRDGVFATRTAAAAANIPASVQAFGLLTYGFATAGDGGGAQYRYAVVQAAGPGKFQSLDGAWWELAEAAPHAKLFGAKGDGAANDTAALQSAIDYYEALGGGRVPVPIGTYLISAALTVQVDGVYLVGDGATRDLAVEIRNTGAAEAIFFGPGIGTPDGSHFNSVGAENMAFVGHAGSTAGVRADNCALHLSNVFSRGHGGRGIHVSRGWGSYFFGAYAQQNTGDNWYLEDGCNAISVVSCGGLSSPAANAMTISGGARGCSNITLISFDGEGCSVGVYLDTSTGNISGLSLIGPNFEGNTSFGVRQSPAGNLFHCQFMAGQYYGAGNGISLSNIFASEIHSPKLFNCNLDISGNKDVYIFMPRLEGTAAINAGIVVSNALGAFPNGSIALGAGSDSFRYPIRQRRGASWNPVREISGLNTNNAGAGAVVQNMDLTAGCLFNTVLSGAATGLTLTVTNDTMATHDRLTVSVETAGGGAAGAVTYPANFKLTGAVAIPAANRKTTVTFVKDGNGIWWEESRATSAG